MLNSDAHLIFGLRWFDHITPALVDYALASTPSVHLIQTLHDVCMMFVLCMIMFECLPGLAPAYLVG